MNLFNLLFEYSLFVSPIENFKAPSLEIPNLVELQ